MLYFNLFSLFHRSASLLGATGHWVAGLSEALVATFVDKLVDIV
jgi:hypothetical protein